jgi:hypothetical protein
MRNREAEERQFGVYKLSDDERIAVRAGLEDARLGNFASDEEMETFYLRLRRQA